PPIPTLASVKTRRRVDMLRACAAGVGAGVGVGDVAGMTVVVSVLESSDGLISPGAGTITAVLLSVPVAVGATIKVTLADNWDERNRSQLIMLDPVQVPSLVETETKVTPAGSVSVMWTGHPTPTLSPDTVME